MMFQYRQKKMKVKFFILPLIIPLIISAHLIISKEEKNPDEWYDTYTQIIGDTISQIDKNAVYFREMYITDGYELPFDGAGGVSDGYPLDCGAFVFYLQDITTDLDDIPELFIGYRTNNGTKILAVYTFNPKTHITYTASVLSQNYNPEIYLCTSNLILEGNKSGGELIMITAKGRMPFAAFRIGQDEDTVIDTNEIPWKTLLNGEGKRNEP
ncbi:MAG: hypothetical protein IJA08_03140 [Clostridia bacterium]|nr:hypothetical protein [Clostridia bacterium]